MATTIASKNFILDTASDIHMTFSACCQITAAMTISAETELIEGTSSTTMPFQPIWMISSNSTIAYCENFQAISAGSTTITVKLQNNTGTMTVNSGQCSLNIITFPLPVTASDTGFITYLIELATASRTLYSSRIKAFDINTANGTLYAGYKWIDGTDKWAILKTTTSSLTAWTDTNMPVATSIYTTGDTSIFNLSIDFNGNNLHVSHYQHATSSLFTQMICAYNYYDGTNWGYPTNMKIISAILTARASNNDECCTHVVSNSSNKIYYFSPLTSGLQYYGMHTSTDYFATRSATTYPFANYGIRAKFLLDVDDTQVHALYNLETNNNLYYRKYSGTAWGTAEIILTSFITIDAHLEKKAMCLSSQGTLYVAQIANLTSTTTALLLFKKTAGATAWDTAWKTFNRSAMDSLAMCFDTQEPPNPIVFYSVASAQICCKKYSMVLSAWESEGTIPLLDTGDIYAQNPHVKYYNGLHIVFESGTAASTAKVAYYYNSSY